MIVRDLSSHNAHDHGTLGKGGSGAVVAVAAGGDRQKGASVSDPPPLPAPHRHVWVEGVVVASGSGTDTLRLPGLPSPTATEGGGAAVDDEQALEARRCRGYAQALCLASRRDGRGKMRALKGERPTQQGGEARLVHSIGDAIQYIELLGATCSTHIIIQRVPPIFAVGLCRTRAAALGQGRASGASPHQRH